MRNKIRNNRIYTLVLTFVMMAMVVAMSAGSVFADSASKEATNTAVAGRGAFEVSAFDYSATVAKNHSIDVEETITITIPEPDTLGRIDFSIPSGNFRVRTLSVENTEFSSNIASQGSTVSITDSAKLTPGVHTFKITYNILEFADRDETSDLLYLTIIPPEWKQPIKAANIKVTFPDDYPMDTLKEFSGHLGVQDTTGLLKSKTNNTEHSITISGKMIPENFGLTLKSTLPNGYWEGAMDGVWALLMILLLVGFVALLLLILWFIGGRDPRIKKTHETKPVDGISAVEIGYIINGEFGIRDIIRLILYFGTKGYLRINEYQPKRYRLFRLEDPINEEKHIRNAYNVLFEDVYKGRSIDLDDIGDRLARMETALHDAVADGFTSKEMLAATPLSKVFRGIGVALITVSVLIINGLQYSYEYVAIKYTESILMGLAIGAFTLGLCYFDDRKYYSSRTKTGLGQIICISGLVMLLLRLGMSIVNKTNNYFVAILVVAMLAVCIFLTVIMRARGKGNAALVMKLKQLRKFIYHPTPKEILENYLADNNYYYDMMIYALMVGAEESWAISFLTLDVPEPDWFEEDIEGHAFSNIRSTPTTIDYARDLRSFVSTVISGYQSMPSRRRKR